MKRRAQPVPRRPVVLTRAQRDAITRELMRLWLPGARPPLLSAATEAELLQQVGTLALGSRVRWRLS